MRIRVYDLVLDKDTGHSSLQLKDSFNDKSKTSDITSAPDIKKLMTESFHLDSKADEYVYMIAFNTKMRVLGVFEISHGTADCSPVEPRGVFMRALFAGATNIILVHNHPSSVEEVFPSKEDKKLSKRIKEAGDLLGIKLLDHIIIGGDNFYSFMENEEL